MPVSVVSATPTVTAQGVGAPTLVLQPGTVITAQVLSVLDANLVRIAIANLTLDVQSQVALQAGTTLNLAVSQTAQGGVQLAIVPAGASAGQAATATAGNAVATAATIASGQATDTSAIARTGSTPAATVTAFTLTPAETAAVIAASQAAAARQGGLSTLFANLGATVESLPAPLQQAAAQLLAARPALTPAIDAGTIETAFQNSGLFLEAGLAGGPPLPGLAGGPPDLKAALLVLRQVLSTLGDQAAAPVGGNQVNPAAAVAETADATAHGAGSALSPGAVPQAGGAAALEAAIVLLAGEEAAPLVPADASQASARVAALNLLQEVEAQASSSPTAATTSQAAASAEAAPNALRAPATAAAAAPPPPFRGAPPSAQAVASPTIAADAATHEVVRRLATDTDGAIARQTLLQIASLPGQADAGAADRMTARWNFEIPFATPQGTAVAQFEISGDGGGQAVGAVQKVWRARFTLNVEPTGPVHATVTFAGGTTSVRMWAERPQTAAQLRANQSQLTAALRQADLEPGDIVIGDGAPPQLAIAAPAGRFLDRAT